MQQKQIKQDIPTTTQHKKGIQIPLKGRNISKYTTICAAAVGVQHET